jgi:hypothetical protein
MPSVVLLQADSEGHHRERHTLMVVIRDLISILAVQGFMEAGVQDVTTTTMVGVLGAEQDLGQPCRLWGIQAQELGGRCKNTAATDARGLVWCKVINRMGNMQPLGARTLAVNQRLET